MTERRVVVTGIGTINPLGNNIEEYFSNLEKGVSGAAPITHFDAEKFKTKFACEVKNYDSNLYFDRKEVRPFYTVRSDRGHAGRRGFGSRSGDRGQGAGGRNMEFGHRRNQIFLR